MAAVATADVVVTNPDPLRRGDRLRPANDRAPRVVAKGVEVLAADQRARTPQRGAVVENPPLARSLHAVCEVDDIVPPRLYASVARLLAFVYSLSPTAGPSGTSTRWQLGARNSDHAALNSAPRPGRSESGQEGPGCPGTAANSRKSPVEGPMPPYVPVVPSG